MTSTMTIHFELSKDREKKVDFRFPIHHFLFPILIASSIVSGIGWFLVSGSSKTSIAEENDVPANKISGSGGKNFFLKKN